MISLESEKGCLTRTNYVIKSNKDGEEEEYGATPDREIVPLAGRTVYGLSASEGRFGVGMVSLSTVPALLRYRQKVKLFMQLNKGGTANIPFVL